MADEYHVQVRMNAGPFEIDKEHKSVLRKSDLEGNPPRMIFNAAAAD